MDKYFDGRPVSSPNGVLSLKAEDLTVAAGTRQPAPEEDTFFVVRDCLDNKRLLAGH